MTQTEKQNTTYENVKTGLITAGAIIGAGVAIYGLNILLPYIVMESAKAGAMAGISSTVSYVPGASYVVNGTVVNQIGTVAAGKAYATMEAVTGLGANLSTTCFAAGIGSPAGSNITKSVIKGTELISACLPSWTSRVNSEKNTSQTLSIV